MKKNYLNSLKEIGIFSLLKVSLKGISQVILIENTISGFIILITIMLSSYSLGLIAFISAIIGTIIGKIGGANKEKLDQGLFGFNSVLTGMALYLFLEGPNMWMVSLAGAAVTAILTATMMHFMKNTDLPILTFPFIILTWLTLLASFKIKGIILSPKLVPQDLTKWELHNAGEVNIFDGVFRGIGQVFFLNYAVSGILIFIALFFANRKLGFYAMLGNAVAVTFAYFLGAEHILIVSGLYGYNAILTIIAVSIVFKKDHNRFAPISGIVAACLTVPITAGVSSFLIPYGLPSLTMPFVLCTWMFLGSRKILYKL